MHDMEDKAKTKEQLINELTGLRRQLARFKESKTAHEQIEKALQESEEIHGAVVESVADGIAITVGTERVFVNRGFLSIHGLQDTSQVVGLPLDQFILSEDRETVNMLVLAMQRGESSKNLVEYRIHRADGAIRTLQASAVTISYKGQPATLAVLRDITPTKEAEKEILRLNRELEQHIMDLRNTNDELETFNSTVSHDLRTPLISIDGFSRKIVEKYSQGFDEKLAEYMSVIRTNTTKMQQLISDLLTYSRVGRQAMSHSLISMQGLVESVVNELRPIYPEGEVIVSPIPESIGDEQMIRQVLTNFLSNAFKFTKYSHSRHIEVRGWAEANENVYSIRDNGAGFEMHYKEKLFNAFQRLHTSEKFEGTGIGLAIVKRIINLHRGRVWADGKPDEGATFYFSMPKQSDTT